MNEDRAAQLWDLVYGLLDEAEATQLRMQICSDRELAKEYARVKLKSELVAAAAKAAQCDCEPLGPPQAFRIPASKGKSTASSAWSAAGILALSLTLVVFAGYLYLQEDSPVRPSVAMHSVEELAEAYPRLLVVGPSELKRGQPAEYEVLVQNPANERPLEVPVGASLENRNGQVAWREEAVTGQDGTYRFQLPESFDQDAYRLRVVVDPKDGKNDGGEGNKGAELSTWLRASDSVPTYAWSEQVRTIDGKVLQSRVYYAPPQLSIESWREISAKSGVELGKRQFDDTVKNDTAKKVSQHQKDTALRYELSTVEEPYAASESRVPAVQAELPRPGLDDLATRDAPPSTISAGGFAGNPGGVAAADAPTPMKEAEAINTPALDEKSVLNAPEQPLNDLSFDKQTTSAPRILVEALWDGNGRMKTRLLDRDRAESEKLSERIAGGQNELATTPGSRETINGALLDYSQAPPQPVELYAAMAKDDGGQSELAIRIDFDRVVYYPGDEITAQVKVADASRAGVPAILSVEVEAVPAEVADKPFNAPPSSEIESFERLSGDEPPFPLLYDNAAAQHAQLEEISHDYFSQRQVARRQAGTGLLIGSGFGLCFLATLTALRRLPRAAVWLPGAVLLGISSAVGVIWLRIEEQVPLRSPEPLTNFGIRSELLPSDVTEPVELLSSSVVPAKESRSPSDVVAAGTVKLVPETIAGKEVSHSLPRASELVWLATNDTTKHRELGLDVVSRADLPTRADVASPSFNQRPTLDTKDHGILAADGSPRSGIVFWHPALQLPETGEVHLHFQLADLAVAYRVVVRARSSDRQGVNWRYVPNVVPGNFTRLAQ